MKFVFWDTKKKWKLSMWDTKMEWNSISEITHANWTYGAAPCCYNPTRERQDCQPLGRHPAQKRGVSSNILIQFCVCVKNQQIQYFNQCCITINYFLRAKPNKQSHKTRNIYDSQIMISKDLAKIHINIFVEEEVFKTFTYIY